MNTKNDQSYTLAAHNASIQIAFHWFHASKAFDNRRDHRTYAQVTKTMKSDYRNRKGLYPCTSAPCMVTVNNKNVKVNPTFVTPSKMSINAQGCTSSKETLELRSWVQTGSDSPAYQQKGFFINRFHILTDLDFFYLGFYIAFNTVQVISRQVVERSEETST